MVYDPADPDSRKFENRNGRETVYDLSVSGQAIDYVLAKQVFTTAGLCFHRKNDSCLHVLPCTKEPGDKYGGWFNGKQPRRKDSPRIVSLEVEEGYFTGVVYADHVGCSEMCRELIPMKDFLGALVAKFAPDAKVDPSPYMGRGFTARHYEEQYYTILKEAELPDCLTFGVEQEATEQEATK